MKKDFAVNDLEQRNKGIGGSDAGAIMGVSPFKKAKALWMEKTERKTPYDLSKNKKVQMGNIMEPVILKMYAESKGFEVEEDHKTHYHPEYPFMFAHIDGWVPSRERVVEIKTASNPKPWDLHGVPDHYKYQCMHYCAILGVYTADVAVLINGHDFRIYNLQFTDEDFINLINKETEFWQCVENDEWPELGDEEPPIETNDIEAIDLCKRIRELKDREKTLKDERSALEEGLKLIIGDHNVICDEVGNELATYKVSFSSRFDSKLFKNENEALYNRYLIEKEVRTLRINNKI